MRVISAQFLGGVLITVRGVAPDLYKGGEDGEYSTKYQFNTQTL